MAIPGPQPAKCNGAYLCSQAPVPHGGRFTCPCAGGRSYCGQHVERGPHCGGWQAGDAPTRGQAGPAFQGALHGARGASPGVLCRSGGRRGPLPALPGLFGAAAVAGRRVHVPRDRECELHGRGAIQRGYPSGFEVRVCGRRACLHTANARLSPSPECQRQTGDDSRMPSSVLHMARSPSLLAFHPPSPAPSLPLFAPPPPRTHTHTFFTPSPSLP